MTRPTTKAAYMTKCAPANKTLKLFHLWDREMAQQIRTLTALAEDRGSIPSTHMLILKYNSIFKESDTLFCLQEYNMHIVHKYTSRQNAHTQFNLKSNYLKIPKWKINSED